MTTLNVVVERPSSNSIALRNHCRNKDLDDCIVAIYSISEFIIFAPLSLIKVTPILSDLKEEIILWHARLRQKMVQITSDGS